MIHYLYREQVVSASLEEVWDFFSTPRNLNALTPDELSFRIIGEPAGSMYEGQVIEYRVSFMKGIWSKWLTEITHVSEKRFFVDEQRVGPYKLWHHEHHFLVEGGSVEVQKDRFSLLSSRIVPASKIVREDAQRLLDSVRKRKTEEGYSPEQKLKDVRLAQCMVKLSGLKTEV